MVRELGSVRNLRCVILQQCGIIALTKIGETLKENPYILKGNSEGNSRSIMQDTKLSYIAGFLDGDGCIMLQLIRRKDYKLGYEIRASVIFYQKQKNKYFLTWLKNQLKLGYLRDRNDGMSEYTIVGVKPVQQILQKIAPFLILKKEHCKVVLRVLKKMPQGSRGMEAKKLLQLSKEVDKFFFLNYSKKRTNTSQKLEAYLRSHKILSP